LNPRAGTAFLSAFLLAALAGGCARPALVMLNREYDFSRVKRVAVMSFSDFPGMPGSGDVAASAFDKYLMGDYTVVERRQATGILREQYLHAAGGVDPANVKKIGRLLGVDALVFGDLNDFTDTRDRTVMVDIPQEHAEPVYGHVVTETKVGESTVTTVQPVVTGYEYHETSRYVPVAETIPARAAFSVRLVDVETGEVIWSASASSEGSDLADASEKVSGRIVKAVRKQMRKAR